MDSVLEDVLDLVDCSDALLRSEDAAVQAAVSHLVHHVVATCGRACVREQERCARMWAYVAGAPVCVACLCNQAGCTSALSVLVLLLVLVLRELPGLL